MEVRVATAAQQMKISSEKIGKRFSEIRNSNQLNQLNRRNKIATTFVRHTACPRCGSRDNRAEYSDGSSWCFGCSTFTRGGLSSAQLREVLLQSNSDADGGEVDLRTYPTLPQDCSIEFPDAIGKYLSRYAIQVGDAVRRGLLWSNFYEQLIFPYYSYRERGRLVCIQARNFNKERASKAKYFNQGSASETLPIYKASTHRDNPYEVHGERDANNGLADKGKLLITEDALSAIKIAHQCDAMPCLGTYLPKHKIMALRPLYSSVIVWLDHDKWREARAIADSFKLLGVKASTLLTELDPKCYTDDEIYNWIQTVS